jgi:hypothetical protein
MKKIVPIFYSLITKNFTYLVVKLGHFIVNAFFLYVKKTLKLNSKSQKTKKKQSLVGLAFVKRKKMMNRFFSGKERRKTSKASP